MPREQPVSAQHGAQEREGSEPSIDPAQVQTQPGRAGGPRQEPEKQWDVERRAIGTGKTGDDEHHPAA